MLRSVLGQGVAQKSRLGSVFSQRLLPIDSKVCGAYGNRLDSLRFQSSSLDDITTADICVIGGGPIGTEVARLSSLIGLSGSTVVVDPRGCLLAAPTGYVSKVLLDVSNQVAAGRRGSRFVWDYAEEHLANTANRALNLTRMQFDNLGSGQMPNVLAAHASFVGIDDQDGEYLIRATSSSDEDNNSSATTIKAKTVFVATGSRSTRLPSLPWDSSDSAACSFLYDSDSIRSIGRVPEHIVIQGGGLIGVEYAFIFRRLGSRVTLCLREAAVLEGKAVDDSIGRAVGKRLHEAGVEVRYGDGDIAKIDLPEPECSMTGKVALQQSGDVLVCDALLSALGRRGCADCLDIETANLSPHDDMGHLPIDDDLRALTTCK